MLLDVGTKGGALFLSFVLFLVPILGYNFVTGVLGYDEIEAGKWIGVGFTVVTTLLWASTYIFRVATKDMTYVSNAEKHKSEQNFLLVDAATEHSHIFFLSHFFPAWHQKAKQLKDYENAVIAKRLEELDEDEIQALVEDIERDDF